MKIQPQNRRAFTFADLMAVVSVLAVLAILAAPCLGSFQPPGDRAICAANLRQLSQATIMYAGDNRDFLPLPGAGTEAISWAHGPNLLPGAGNLNALPAQLAKVPSGLLWPYYKSLEMLRCPGDRTNTLRELNLYRSRAVFITSYNMSWNVGETSVPGSPITYRLAQFRPDAIFFAEPDETDAFNFNDCTFNPANPSEGFSTRHSDVPVGCADGSVEWLPFSAISRMRSESVANRLLIIPRTASGR